MIHNFFTSILPQFTTLIWNLGAALLIFLIGRKAISLLLKVIERSLECSQMEQSVRQFIRSFSKAGLHVLLLLSVIQMLGVPAASIIAVLGSAGLAVGMALQGSLSNFAGGVLILLLKPFKVGDYIIEDGRKNEGTVRDIGLFYTTLTAGDNRKIVLPNGPLANTSLTNVSSSEIRRLDIMVGISYNADIKLAKSLLLDIINSKEAVIKDRPIQVFISELDNSTATLGLRAWVPGSSYRPTKWEVTEQIKDIFDANHMEITIKEQK